MLNICSRCDKPLQEGDEVQFVATGIYHNLPSSRSWAIDKHSLEADIRSIKHIRCHDGD